MSVKEDYEGILVVLKRHEEEIKKVNEKKKEIQSRLKAGESTGDRIKDYLICTQGVYPPELYTLLKNLDQKLSKKKGSLVMLLGESTEKDEHGHGYIPDFMDRKVYEHKIGVLDPQIEFDLAGGIMLSQKYVHNFNNSLTLPNTWCFSENPLKTDSLEILDWNEGQKITEKLRKRLNAYDRIVTNTTNLKILVGDEVEEYFVENPENLIGGIDLSYIEALNLLGKNPGKKFLEAYDRKIEEEKSALIKKILSEKDTGRLKDHLREALELELDNANLTIETETPGVKIDIGDYVTGLCKKYGITRELKSKAETSKVPDSNKKEDIYEHIWGEDPKEKDETQKHTWGYGYR